MGCNEEKTNKNNIENNINGRKDKIGEKSIKKKDKKKDEIKSDDKEKEKEKENDSIIEIKTDNINNNKNINNQIKEKEKEIPETKEKIKNFNCGNYISLLTISERKVAIILEIFDKDNVYYNDIPILSLEKINKYNIPKKTKRSKYIHSDEEIIQTNNEKDNLYNGLTERQFLYKISHNKSNKNINEKVKNY